MHVVLFYTIDMYTTIMLNWLSVASMAQLVEHLNIAHLYSEALRCSFESRMRHLLLYLLKRLLLLFLLNFLLLQYRFSILINSIFLLTTTFSRPIRNTVLQLSPVISSIFNI